MHRNNRVWATPLVLLCLLALLAIGVWWGVKALTRPLGKQESQPCVSQQMSVLQAGAVTVHVYNGGGTTGLAGSTASQLKAKGFNVPTAANASEKVDGTIIVGGKSDDPQVQLVSGFFPGSAVRADGRTDASVDVLVGAKFAGLKEDAPNEINVPGGTVCLPAPASSAPPESAGAPAANAPAAAQPR